MIRLTTTIEANHTVVSVHGRLDAAGVEQLQAVLAGLPIASTEIDLLSVESLDEAGRRFLAALKTQGVSMRNATLYIDHLLRNPRP